MKSHRYRLLLTERRFAGLRLALASCRVRLNYSLNHPTLRLGFQTPRKWQDRSDWVIVILGTLA